MLAEVTLPSNGGRVNLVNRVEIHSSEYRHDTAIFRATALPSSRLKKDAPVSITYGRGTFRGYVLSKTYDKSTVTVRCIGMTSPCRSGRQRSWKNVSDAQIVQQIASLNKLTAAVEPLKKKHKMLNQAGKSDWQFMVERAKANGFVVYPRGPQIRFHSRAFELERYGNAAPRLDGASMLSFHPDVTEAVEGGGPKATVTVSGVDANGQPLSGSEKPTGAGVLSRFNTKAVATSVADAQERAAAEAALNSWTYRARAEVHGNPLLRVGGPVFFGDVEGDYEGFWVVQQTIHIITPTIYTTQLTVGVDRLGRGVSTPPTVAADTVQKDDLGDASWAPDDIVLMDPSDIFDPESDAPAPEDLSHMMIDYDPYDGVEPSETPLQWAVPSIQPDNSYDAIELTDNILSLQDEPLLDDGYVVKLLDEPPAWLLERAYP